jgi:hypothetical protein
MVNDIEKSILELVCELNQSHDFNVRHIETVVNRHGFILDNLSFYSFCNAGVFTMLLSNDTHMVNIGRNFPSIHRWFCTSYRRKDYSGCLMEDIDV